MNREELDRQIEEMKQLLAKLDKKIEIFRRLAEEEKLKTEEPQGTLSVDDVRALFPSDLEELLTFEEKDNTIIVRPRRFLGSENFAKIAHIVRANKGEYISAGKQSHFKIPTNQQ